MQANPGVWFEIYVDDITRARLFYEGVFQTTLTPMADPTASQGQGPEMWAFSSEHGQPGAAGALVKMDGFGPGAGGSLIYLGCQDCAVEAARAAELGGKIVQPKFSIGEHGFCALISDTEGNVIGLHSMQ